MILDPKNSYITMDKSGLILRFFNNGFRNITSYKNDIIAIAYKKGDSFEYERRNIIEIINSNTIIVDAPFPRVKDMPEYIFDFKRIV